MNIPIKYHLWTPPFSTFNLYLENLSSTPIYFLRVHNLNTLIALYAISTTTTLKIQMVHSLNTLATLYLISNLTTLKSQIDHNLDILTTLYTTSETPILKIPIDRGWYPNRKDTYTHHTKCHDQNLDSRWDRRRWPHRGCKWAYLLHSYFV